MTAVAEADELIAHELEELARWAERRGSGSDIRRLREHVSGMVEEEMARLSVEGAFDADQVERLRAFATRMTNKLLHGPTVELRDADDADRSRILRLFGVED
jgi:glutamyl-tRNA reductase